MLVIFGLLLIVLFAPVSNAQTDSISWDHPLIAIVWPQDGQGHPTTVTASMAVNVSVWPTHQVPCASPFFLPNRLYVARNNEPGDFFTEPQVILRTAHGVTFPSQEFNNVPANMALDPAAKYHFVLLAGSNVWVHAADLRTFYPQPVMPVGVVSGHLLIPLDLRIQIVWPHDAWGRYSPVSQATLVNIAVDIFQHGTLLSIPPDYISDEYEVYSPFLSVAMDNQPLQGTDPNTGQHIWPHAEQTSYTVNGQTFPRWVFNDVPVQPGHQYHFLALVEFRRATPTLYPTIWTHAADARTMLPAPSVPPPCVPLTSL